MILLARLLPRNNVCIQSAISTCKSTPNKWLSITLPPTGSSHFLQSIKASLTQEHLGLSVSLSLTLSVFLCLSVCLSLPVVIIHYEQRQSPTYLFGEHVPEKLIEKVLGIKQIDKNTSKLILQKQSIQSINR